MISADITLTKGFITAWQRIVFIMHIGMIPPGIINAAAAPAMHAAYKAMTANYSPESPYGYGMFLELQGGVGHYGAIGIYSAFDYVNADKKLTLAVLGNTIDPTSMTGLAGDLLMDLTK